MKWFSILVILALSSTVYGIDIDPLLLEHSLYATTMIHANHGCTTPLNGRVGTNGVYAVTGTNTIQTNVWAKELNGGWEYFKVLDDTMYYETAVGSDNMFNFLGMSDTIYQTPIYPDTVVFPDLSGIKFLDTGSVIDSDLTHSDSITPGHYSELHLGNLDTLYMQAGTYHVSSIDLISHSHIIITPYNGNYTTDIYVDDHLNLGNYATISPQDSSGYGNVGIYYKGTSPITLISDSKVVATLIAENATINFRDGAILVGQAMADVIDLTGFDGGIGIIYTPLNQVKIVPEDKTFLESDGDTVMVISLADGVPDSAGTINWEIVNGTAVYGQDLTNKYLSNGLLFFPKDSKMSTDDIHIDIYDDIVFEGDETFTLRLYNPSDNINLGSSDISFTITIIDNDPENAHPPIVETDTVFCNESGNWTWTPTVTDADNP